MLLEKLKIVGNCLKISICILILWNIVACYKDENILVRSNWHQYKKADLHFLQWFDEYKKNFYNLNADEMFSNLYINEFGNTRYNLINLDEKCLDDELGCRYWIVQEYGVGVEKLNIFEVGGWIYCKKKKEKFFCKKSEKYPDEIRNLKFLGEKYGIVEGRRRNNDNYFDVLPNVFDGNVLTFRLCDYAGIVMREEYFLTAIAENGREVIDEYLQNLECKNDECELNIDKLDEFEKRKFHGVEESLIRERYYGWRGDYK